MITVDMPMVVVVEALGVAEEMLIICNKNDQKVNEIATHMSYLSREILTLRSLARQRSAQKNLDKKSKN